jgi:uncharacterized RDD family membrane protein YckC
MKPLPSPGLARRLAAILYDTLLVLPLIMLAVAIATGLAVAITGDSGDGDYSATLPPLVVQAIALLCVLAFYGTFWRLRGQTLGMQAWRIRLRSFDGSPVRLRQVVLRCLAAVLSILPLGAGYLWCIVDRHGRCWHDYLSRTELELLPKRRRQGEAEPDSQEAGVSS